MADESQAAAEAERCCNDHRAENGKPGGGGGGPHCAGCGGQVGLVPANSLIPAVDGVAEPAASPLSPRFNASPADRHSVVSSAVMFRHVGGANCDDDGGGGHDYDTAASRRRRTRHREHGLPLVAEPHLRDCPCPFEQSPRGTLFEQMRPVLVSLSVAGFYSPLSEPGAASECGRDRESESGGLLTGGKRRCAARCGRMALAALAISFISLTGYFVYFNVKHTLLRFIGWFGMLHALSIAAIMTGLKPLIAAATMLHFVLCHGRHRRMLAAMSDTDERFRRVLNFGQNARVRARAFAALCLAVFGVVAAMRLVDAYLGEGPMFGRGLIQDTSYLLVPMLSVWNFMPLLYFEILQRQMRQWCYQLRAHVRRESIIRRRPLSTYYQLFVQLARCQMRMADFFNAYILFSLSWSLFTLCLTIYFVTQAGSSVDDYPPIPAFRALMERDAAKRWHWHRMIYTSYVWNGVQIAAAVLHILTICTSGLRTNEATRSVSSAALDVAPYYSKESDRFFVPAFVHKVQTQYVWGASVFKAFPLERTSFFTIVSLIATYTLFLLKMKQDLRNEAAEAALAMRPATALAAPLHNATEEQLL